MIFVFATKEYGDAGHSEEMTYIREEIFFCLKLMSTNPQVMFKEK